MYEAWLHFVVVIFLQAILFTVCAHCQKKLSDIPRILGWGILTGVVFGLLFDLVAGKLFGLHSYTLGFGAPFLIINATLSYGLFAATMLLLQRAQLLPFYLWTVAVVAVYEIANLFFRVWTWEFSLPQIEFLLVLSAGYFGGAVLIATVWHVFLGYRFSFIDNLFGRKA